MQIRFTSFERALPDKNVCNVTNKAVDAILAGEPRTFAAASASRMYTRIPPNRSHECCRSLENEVTQLNLKFEAWRGALMSTDTATDVAFQAMHIGTSRGALSSR